MSSHPMPPKKRKVSQAPAPPHPPPRVRVRVPLAQFSDTELESGEETETIVEPRTPRLEILGENEFRLENEATTLFDHWTKTYESATRYLIPDRVISPTQRKLLDNVTRDDVPEELLELLQEKGTWGCYGKHPDEFTYPVKNITHIYSTFN